MYIWIYVRVHMCKYTACVKVRIFSVSVSIHFAVWHDHHDTFLCFWCDVSSSLKFVPAQTSTRVTSNGATCVYIWEYNQLAVTTVTSGTRPQLDFKKNKEEEEAENQQAALLLNNDLIHTKAVRQQSHAGQDHTMRKQPPVHRSSSSLTLIKQNNV